MGNADQNYLKVRMTETSAINDIVYEWFCAAEAKNIPLSGPIV